MHVSRNRRTREKKQIGQLTVVVVHVAANLERFIRGARFDERRLIPVHMLQDALIVRFLAIYNIIVATTTTIINIIIIIFVTIGSLSSLPVSMDCTSHQ